MTSQRLGFWWDTPDQQPTRVQKLIFSACTPSFSSPDMNLFLEIAAHINQKKLNTPREAAMAIVSRINSTSPDVGRLALMLLDICVKNCGYPFHLQIASREFLNELVKRFPERPPPRRSERMLAILEQIELWYITICRTARYKDDLGFIRDMHSLLFRKGYTFPTPKAEDVAVLGQGGTVQSAEELEQEDRLVQEAKLQELIRRGTPRDLEQANKLMKVLSGYDERNRTDYRAKAAEEVANVQEKAKLLEEMIQLQMSGDHAAEGDAYEELANALISAHHKIRKMCEEESDDVEAVQKLLAINDSIHRTIQRYKLLKDGQISSASQIAPGTLGTSGPGVSRGAGDDLLLIDLDDPPAAQESLVDDTDVPPQTAVSEPSSGAQNSLMDDLMSLSLGPSMPGAISLPRPGTVSAGPSGAGLHIIPGLGTTGIRPSSQELLSGLSHSSNPSSAPSPSKLSNPQPKNLIGLQQKKSTDPFAALSLGLNPSRPDSKTQSSGVSNTTNLINTGPSTTPAPAPVPASTEPAQSLFQTDDDDQWEFTSALPVVPMKATLHISQPTDPLDIKWEVERQQDGVVQIHSEVKSRVDGVVQGVVVEIATSKAFALTVKPQSATTLARSSDTIRQEISVASVPAGQGQTVQIRWRARYRAGNDSNESKLMGVVNGLGIE